MASIWENPDYYSNTIWGTLFGRLKYLVTAANYGVITYFVKVDVMLFIVRYGYFLLSYVVHPLISIRGDHFSIEFKGPARLIVDLVRADVDFACRLGRG